MSKVCAIYHIVINTKNRRMTIPEEHKRELYQYLHGIILHKQCKTLRINGIPNHIHLLVELNPTLSISELVQTLKQNSSRWLKCNTNFPDFESWGKEYYAFTISKSAENSIIEYIKGQTEHHRSGAIDFESEMKAICAEFGIDWHPGALT